MKFEPVIGLEVHAELSTDSKIYCGCSAAFGGDINTHCCPVCTGMPGSLPVLNKKVVEYAVKMGLATNCKINPLSKQDRKNYFYPDLPKAYQVSQYDVPLCENGHVDFYVGDVKKSVRLHRIHIEEDAGKLVHDRAPNSSLVDFNRCGVPLIEMVTEPDIRSSEEAKAFLEQIKSILGFLGICDCKMQEGSIRCDVNVSIRPEGSEKFGTRVEMKNVNTFSGAVRAIEYEIRRQTELVSEGKEVEQETRRWDDVKGYNYTLRTKEDAQDYRYFPEPDLMPIAVDEAWLNEIRASLPELPLQKLERYTGEYGISQIDANQMIDTPSKSNFFDQCVALGEVSPKVICNWLLGDISKILNETNADLAESKLTPAVLCELLIMIGSNEISGNAGKRVLSEIFETGRSPKEIVDALGLRQVSDEGALKQIVSDVLKGNEKSVIDYKNGKKNAIGFLMGQCMKASKGKGNPQVFSQLLQEMLDQE